MSRWYDSPFTGLFQEFGEIPVRPHDPDVRLHGGLTRRPALSAAGAGWTRREAEDAAAGEAIERMGARPAPEDTSVEASFDSWPLHEPAVDPRNWVLFHAEQYSQPDFPFVPLERTSVCRWTVFRDASSGLPCWVPEELAWLDAGHGGCHRFAPGISTGMACGRAGQPEPCEGSVGQASPPALAGGDRRLGGSEFGAAAGQPVLLRGLQEIVERDGLAGSWWGALKLEEWRAARVFECLDRGLAARVLRPNLRYRFYRVASPHSAHVTIVTCEGEDREGFIFSAGSACRETRPASWTKSILEAVQGRHYARHLVVTRKETAVPRDFADHAAYYSFHPGRLAETVLMRAEPVESDPEESVVERLPELLRRIGRVLFRNVTHPGIASERRDWVVLRVLVPGLQPLHGDHALPHLGGPYWEGKGVADWLTMPPHPYA